MALFLGVFVATALFRFLALPGFPNDQHEHLAGAQQMLLGEWPTRDFFDPGMPLTYGMSALAQLLLGQTLLAEAILNCVAFGVAAACTAVVSRRLSGSLLLALTVSVLSVLIEPRPYAYPKVLTLSLTALAVVWFLSRPAALRSAVLALSVTVAFLFRYDYAAYAGVAAAAAFVVAARSDPREWHRWALAAAVAALVPLGIYAATIGGPRALVDSVGAFVEHGRLHVARNRLSLADLGWHPEGRLFFVFHLLPALVLAWVAFDWWKGQNVQEPIVPLALMAIPANVLLISDPLSARLADAAVPAAVMTAWLGGRVELPRTGWVRPVALTLGLALVAWLGRDVLLVGRFGAQLEHTEVAGVGVARLPSLFVRRAAELRERFNARQMPDGRTEHLVPFFQYLDRCSTTRHRLFVPGYAPDVFVYARRPFAGGQKVFLRLEQSPAEQKRLIAVLDRQVVGYVVVLSDVEAEWRAGAPEVAAYLDPRFAPLTEIPAPGDRIYRVFVNANLPPLGTDAMTGWPCFR
ncbi:MAG: hypothetical protein FJW23_12495 [Acidimicrobiia bacterium]|nr:hypothetical protein [Acidimicrobiia bacterium]